MPQARIVSLIGSPMNHICTNCGNDFKIGPDTLLKTGLGRSQLSGLRSVETQIDDYQRVACPKCGHIDKDDRIRVYGLFRPRTLMYLVLIAMFMFFAVDFLVAAR